MPAEMAGIRIRPLFANLERDNHCGASHPHKQRPLPKSRAAKAIAVRQSSRVQFLSRSEHGARRTPASQASHPPRRTLAQQIRSLLGCRILWNLAPRR